MRDDCVLCKKLFEPGDRGVVIGNVELTDDGVAEPEICFVHIDCIGRSVLGPEKWDAIKDKAQGVVDEVTP